MENWRARREQAHLVRYEDLLTTPEDVLRETFDYVGIDASADVVQRVVRQASEPDAALAFHMTSRDQATSIGRWERDLPEDVQALCSEEFGTALSSSGTRASSVEPREAGFVNVEEDEPDGRCDDAMQSTPR